VTAVAIVSAWMYYYKHLAYRYWAKKNVPQLTPDYPFAALIRMLTGKASIPQMMNRGYEDFKKTGYGGVYAGKPALVVCNPELIKHVLTKDFNNFQDHGMPYDTENDPLSANLFNLSGHRWKMLRSKLSPTFTSGKIKGMFPLVHECVQQLLECLREECKKNNGSVEMQDLLLRYCADVIGSCAFGISCNSLKNPDSEFQHMGREMLTTGSKTFLQFFIARNFPGLRKYVTTRRLFPKTSAFFTGLMEHTVTHRRENNIERNDFVQLMMQIADEETDEKFFNKDIMTAQATIFFIAGLDNVGNQLGFCLHAMAANPDLQERVHKEITSVLADFDGKMCYEAVKKMDLVSRVFDESMRIHTPLGAIMRVATSDKYMIPGTALVIDKGTPIIIPLLKIHMDEEYFPNPEKFDPDRFTEEEKAKRHPYTYMPFGEGPRFCIASRFAKLEMHLCFAELVRHFKFDVAPETDLSLKLATNTIGPSPKNKFWLKVTERAPQ